MSAPSPLFSSFPSTISHIQHPFLLDIQSSGFKVPHFEIDYLQHYYASHFPRGVSLGCRPHHYILIQRGSHRLYHCLFYPHLDPLQVCLVQQKRRPYLKQPRVEQTAQTQHMPVRGNLQLQNNTAFLNSFLVFSAGSRSAGDVVLALPTIPRSQQILIYNSTSTIISYHIIIYKIY